MKKMLLMILVASGFVGAILSSEEPTTLVEQKIYNELNKPVEIFVNFSSNERKLYYVGQKKMEYIKKFTPKFADHTPCFINCKYTSDDLRTDHIGGLIKFAECNDIAREDISHQFDLLAKSERLQKITEHFDALHKGIVIPFHFFITDNDQYNINNNAQFKNKGDVLFKFTDTIGNDKILFEVKLGEDLSKIQAQEIIQQFCSQPTFPMDDRAELEEHHLLKLGTDFGGANSRFVHGGRSYVSFRGAKRLEQDQKKEEENEKQLRQQRQKEMETRELLSQIKFGTKLFVGSSIVALFAYLLYEKLYVTTH